MQDGVLFRYFHILKFKCELEVLESVSLWKSIIIDETGESVKIKAPGKKE